MSIFFAKKSLFFPADSLKKSGLSKLGADAGSMRRGFGLAPLACFGWGFPAVCCGAVGLAAGASAYEEEEENKSSGWRKKRKETW